MTSRFLSALAACGALTLATPALAHVDVDSPGFAGQRQILRFSVGHGCEGDDTIGIRVNLPEEVTDMRALPSMWGEPAVTTSSAGLPLAVEWTKPNARAGDDSFYEFHLRIRVPDMAFATIYFKVTQTCRSATGEVTTVEWAALPGEDGEPAAALSIMPVRHPGWNKFTVPAEITELGMFDDAQIVWAGDAAYSGNPSTMELIAAEPDVEVLTSIPAATTIWVKY